MSAESLKWNSPEELFENPFDVEALGVIVNNLKPIIRELLGKKDRRQIWQKSKEINAILHGLIIDELEQLMTLLIMMMIVIMILLRIG